MKAFSFPYFLAVPGSPYLIEMFLEDVRGIYKIAERTLHIVKKDGSAGRFIVFCKETERDAAYQDLLHALSVSFPTWKRIAKEELRSGRQEAKAI